MTKIIISYKDYVHCNIKGLNQFDIMNLVKKFKVFIPSSRYTPKYKLGIWDGCINFFNVNGNTYVNLVPEILESINLKNYEGIEYIYPNNLIQEPKLIGDIDSQYLSDLIWYEGHRLEGQPVILEEHQVRCINSLLNNPRGILSAATGAGKSLCCAALCRKVQEYGRIVLVVPSKDLCQQTADELKFTGLDVGIVGMGIREFGHQVTVCTWQTINSLERRKIQEYLSVEELQKLTEDVVCLIFDETHIASGNEIKKVLEQTFKNVPIRWGLTGTVPKEKSEYMNLMISLGKTVEEKVVAKELQDKGFLSNCQVNCIRLDDKTKFMSWTDEKEYISNDKIRMKFISNIISGIVQSSKNTLVLIDRIKTGETLEKMLIENGVDAIFLSGSVKTKKRFEEYEKVKTQDNKCIIAIDKIAATGLNIPRLFNVVFIDYGKSFTKIIQSIGRGLRRASDKDFVTIYDISNCTKYSKKHFNERIKYYEEAQYPYGIFEIPEQGWKSTVK